MKTFSQTFHFYALNSRYDPSCHIRPSTLKINFFQCRKQWANRIKVLMFCIPWAILWSKKDLSLRNYFAEISKILSTKWRFSFKNSNKGAICSSKKFLAFEMTAGDKILKVIRIFSTMFLLIFSTIWWLKLSFQTKLVGFLPVN